MPFFKYSQNNSGGFFDHEPNAGIGCVVWIEAESASEADTRALGIGLYFNGVDHLIDCECCGDRWLPASCGGEALPTNFKERFVQGTPSYVHYADGRVTRHES